MAVQERPESKRTTDAAVEVVTAAPSFGTRAGVVPVAVDCFCLGSAEPAQAQPARKAAASTPAGGIRCGISRSLPDWRETSLPVRVAGRGHWTEPAVMERQPAPLRIRGIRRRRTREARAVDSLLVHRGEGGLRRRAGGDRADLVCEVGLGDELEGDVIDEGE